MHKGLLFIMLGLMMFQSLAFGGDLVSESRLTQEFATPDSILDAGGWADFLTSGASLVVGLIVVLFKLATFGGVPGMPVWMRVGLILFFGIAVAEEVVGVVTRIVEAAGSIIPLT